MKFAVGSVGGIVGEPHLISYHPCDAMVISVGPSIAGGGDCASGAIS
jgi:hypothetical protein